MEVLPIVQFSDLRQQYASNELSLTSFAPALLADYVNTFDRHHGNGLTQYAHALDVYNEEGFAVQALLDGQGAFEPQESIFRPPHIDAVHFTSNRFNEDPRLAFETIEDTLGYIFGAYIRRQAEVCSDRCITSLSQKSRYSAIWVQLRELGVVRPLGACIAQEFLASQTRRHAVKTLEIKKGNAANIHNAAVDADTLRRVVDPIYWALGYSQLTYELVGEVIKHYMGSEAEVAYVIFKSMVHMDTRRQAKVTLSNKTLRGPIFQAIENGDVRALINAYEQALKSSPHSFDLSHKYCRDYPGLMHLYEQAIAQ